MLKRFVVAALLVLGLPLVAQAQVPSLNPPFNTDLGSVLTLSGANASVNSTTQTNLDKTGLVCVVNLTAVSGTTPTLTVAIQFQDKASSVWSSLLTSATLNATGSTVLEVFPGATAASNTIANAELPRVWRLAATIGGTTPSFTGTVGCNVMK